MQADLDDDFDLLLRQPFVQREGFLVFKRDDTSNERTEQWG
jgi:hypothetical protein